MPQALSLPVTFEDWCAHFLLFIAYSTIGWCGEMLYCSVPKGHLCEKRGFLNGFLYPIYGFGALLVLYALRGGFQNPLLTFSGGFVLTSTLEYFTSWLMEKLFRMRWWDYSHYKFQINGRVCLLNSTCFPLACVALCHFVHPWLSGKIFALGTRVTVPLASFFFGIFLTDTALSIRSAIQLSGQFKKLLILQDDVFLTGIKNTFMIAVVTGPIGYIMSFLFAWLINELPRWIRSVAVIVFYAPSIAGNVYVIFSIFFKGDAYGHVNALLMNTGLIDAPILWLVNPTYMLPICMLVILWMSLGSGFLSFVAGLQGVDRSQYEAGYMDGIKNRWQELWYITLPNMKPMLMFGAVMAITQSFGVCDVTMALCGYPSTDYAARTIVTHLFDYGFSRFEMGYASAIATILFLMMILCNKAIQSMLRRVGT